MTVSKYSTPARNPIHVLLNLVLTLGMLPATVAASIFITDFQWQDNRLRAAAFERLSDIHIRYLDHLDDGLRILRRLDFDDPSRFIPALAPPLALLFFILYVAAYDRPVTRLVWWLLTTGTTAIVLSTLLFPAV